MKKSVEATGQFTVKISMLDPYAEATPGGTLGRMSIDKEFTGGLIATSQGEMLTAMTEVKDSAGYVAIEKVRGSLAGKTGTFILQHYGIVRGGETRLTLEVVADSGTAALTHLSGSMTIDQTADGHYYTLTYEL